MGDETQGPSRRSVLKNLAAAGTFAAGVTGASGSAGASVDRQPSKVRPVEEAVGDAETVETLFAEHGQPLVDALADGGHVDASLDPAVDAFVPTDEYAASDRDGLATASPGRVGDTEVVDVRLQQQVGDTTVEFHLLPDAGDSYALLSAPDSDDGTLVYGSGETQEVSTQGCSSACDCDTRCTDDECQCIDYHWYYEEQETCLFAKDGSGCSCFWERTGCYCRGDRAWHCDLESA